LSTAALPVSAGVGSVRTCKSEVPAVSPGFNVATTATPGTSDNSSSA
jgi:hypothetical protein